MHAILAQYNLPYRYPRDVEKYAESLSDKIPEEEYAKREDFRDVVTITIDPADAKDFDDALSLRKISDNLWEVVHIADVTYYVKPGDPIDRKPNNGQRLSIWSIARCLCFRRG